MGIQGWPLPSERKSDPTSETAPFFLHHIVKTATHSLWDYHNLWAISYSSESIGKLIMGRNMLQFLLISAHDHIKSTLISWHVYHLSVWDPAHETAPLFLIIITQSKLQHILKWLVWTQYSKVDLPKVSKMSRGILKLWDLYKSTPSSSLIFWHGDTQGHYRFQIIV